MQVQIRYSISSECPLNCEFCTVKPKANPLMYLVTGEKDIDTSLQKLDEIVNSIPKDIPISIGYYEEAYLHLDVIDYCVDKYPHAKHYIKTSGILPPNKQVLDLVQKDNVIIDFGYKKYIHQDNLDLVNKHDNMTVTGYFFPVDKNECDNFIHMINDLSDKLLPHVFDYKFYLSIVMSTLYENVSYEELVDNIEYIKTMLNVNDDIFPYNTFNCITRYNGINNIETVYLYQDGTIFTEGDLVSNIIHGYQLPYKELNVCKQCTKRQYCFTTNIDRLRFFSKYLDSNCKLLDAIFRNKEERTCINEFPDLQYILFSNFLIGGNWDEIVSEPQMYG